jgi:hypothetical protein
MKITLKVASILTWFNLIYWGLPVAVLLLASLSTMNMPFLAVTVLFSSIPLNAYAALKLHRSIRRPTLPLSNQTPVGIRFVGFIALFFGIVIMGAGFEILKASKEVFASLKGQLSGVTVMPPILQEQYKNLSIEDFHRQGIFVLLFGLAIVVNVVLNLRLLRWYYLVGKSDASQEKQ